jgi:hypothetical protein
MVARLSNWLDERLAWRNIWEGIFLRNIPKTNWLFTLGSATLFLAVNQFVTGRRERHGCGDRFAHAARDFTRRL